MKAESTGNGFSTIEIIIAFAIITVSLTMATSISFISQNLLLDSQISLNSISNIESKLRSENSFSTTSTYGIYNEQVSNLYISNCVKKTTFLDTWKMNGVLKSIYFSQIFTDTSYFSKILEPCDAPEFSSEEWKDRQEINYSIDVENVTDIDIVGDFAFVSSNTDALEDSDLYIFDIKNNYKKISELNVGEGIFSIDATSDFVYAVANSTSSQFLIIDVQNKNAPLFVSKRNLFGVWPEGSFPQGRSVRYFDGRVYVGTKETAGPEFHIFNVLNPSNPYEIGFIELSHNINDIWIKDNKAYLATSADTKELIVIDVANPSGMFEVGFFNAGNSSVNDKDATSIYVIGDILYLGRKRGAILNPEFYFVDISSPSNPKKIGEANVALSGLNSYISSIVVSNDIAFLSTTDMTKSLIALDVSDPLNVKEIFLDNFNDSLSSIDIQNGVLYGASVLNQKIYEIYRK